MKLTKCEEPEAGGSPTQRGDLVIDGRTELASASDIDISFESRHLEDYFTWEHVNPHLDGSTARSLADATFVEGLDDFTAATESQLLYAHGQYHIQGADVLRQWALAYKSLAQAAGVPVISYFCELSHDEPLASRTRESVELSALIYALIRQLVNFLPVGNADMAALGAGRFSALDGTHRTWKEALRVLEDLVAGARLPLMLFVIHGLNVVEDDFEHSTDDALEELVHYLARISGSRSTGEGRICKVLFTTSGLSETLSSLLDERSVISCGSTSPGGPRQSRRARKVVSY